MAESTQNLMNTAPDETAVTSALTSIKAAQTALKDADMLTTLTPAQRETYRSYAIRDERKENVDTVIDELRNGNALEFLPRAIDPQHLYDDLGMHNALEKIEQSLMSLLQQIQDAKLLSGAEAYKMSLQVYDAAQAGDRFGIAGAKALYDKLKPLFDRSSAAEPARGYNDLTGEQDLTV